MFFFLVVLVTYSLSAQAIDWKVSSPKCADGDVKHFSLTHALSDIINVITLQHYKEDCCCKYLVQAVRIGSYSA